MTYVSSTASLSEALAVLALRKPITASDRRAAAILVLDAVANALAGRVTEPGRLVRDWYHAVNAGTERDPGREAFVMGAFTHSLETDDLHRASVVHPGCVVVPAAWVAARAVGADGTAFLDAVIRGVEAATRVGMAVGPSHYKIWHNTATCGPFGAAVAAGSLLGLDSAAMAHALGNAGTQSAGLWEFLADGAMSKHLHAGRAAEAGWLAASLAKAGFTGPRRILEGDRGFFAATCPDAQPGKVLEEPDAPWQVHATSIKPWPCCRHTHPAIDAALSLRAAIQERGLGPETIGAVHVRTYQAAIDVCDRISPRSDYQAKFSLQHCVGAALNDGKVDFSAFGEEARKRVGPVRARVTLMLDPAYEAPYPDAWGASVSATLRDGTRLDAAVKHAKGDPEAPLSLAELVTKAKMLLTHGGVETPGQWIELLLAIEKAPALPDLSRFWGPNPLAITKKS